MFSLAILYHLWLPRFLLHLHTVFLVNGPPRVIVHFPTGPSYIKNVLLPQTGILIKDRNNGPFEIPNKLRRHRTTHCLATIKRVLLRNRPVQAAGSVTRVQLDLQQRLRVLHRQILEPERPPVRGRVLDRRERNQLLFFRVFVHGDPVGAHAEFHVAGFRLEHLLTEALQLGDFFEQPILRRGRFHPTAVLVLFYDLLEEIRRPGGALRGHDARSLHVHVVRGVQGVVIAGLHLRNERD